jgi:hypothetical protein
MLNLKVENAKQRAYNYAACLQANFHLTLAAFHYRGSNYKYRSYALTTGAKDGFKLFVVKTHSEMKERTTFENKSRRT